MTGTLTRPNANPVLNMMRDADTSDRWGWAISWAFSACDVLWDADPNMVPAEVKYRPAMAGPELPGQIPLGDLTWETAEVWAWLHDADVSEDATFDAETLDYWSDPTFAGRADELRTAIVCLSRYLDWCKLAGIDY